MPKDPSKPESNHSAASQHPAKDDVMSLLAEFESSVADLRRMAGQTPEVRPEQRIDTPRAQLAEHGSGQNAVIRTELDELRNTLSRRALEMDQRAFDLERRRRELEEEAERLRQSIAEQARQTQIRESLVEKHESEFAGRLTQLTGQAQESERSRVLAEEKLKATELAHSQAEARAKELESQITATSSGGAEVERKLLELSNRIAQAEAELSERRRKGALDAELLSVAEQKRVEAEARSEASRQTLWATERELGELRDRAARQNASNICDLQVKQAVVEAQARIVELERDVWLRQQEVDRARDERAEAMKDADRASELASKAESVAQHTVAAVEALRQQITARTAELDAERVTLQQTIARLKAELESARSGASEATSQQVDELRAAAAQREAALEADLKAAAAVAESERASRIALEASLQQIAQEQSGLQEKLAKAQALAQEKSEEALRFAASCSTGVQEQAALVNQIRTQAEEVSRVQANRIAELELALRAQQTEIEHWESQINDQHAAHAVTLAALVSELASAKQDSQVVQRQAAELAEARSALESLSSDAVRTLDETQAQHALAIEALKAQIERSRTELMTSEQERSAASKRAAQLEQRLESIESESERLRASAAAMQQECDGLTARSGADRATIADQDERVRAMQAKLEDMVQANQELSDRIAAAERAAEEARAEHERSLTDAERARERALEEVSGLEQQISQQREIITSLKSSKDSGQAQAAQAQEARIQAERQVLELQARCNELSDQAARTEESAQSQTSRLRETVSELEAQVNTERNESQSRLQEAQSELQAVRGKLSQMQATTAEEHARLEAEIQSTQQAFTRAQAEGAAAKADLARLSGAQSDQVAQSQRVITQLREDVAALQATHSQINSTLDHTRQESTQRERELLAALEQARTEMSERESAWSAQMQELRSAQSAAASDQDTAALTQQLQKTLEEKWDQERRSFRGQIDAAQQQASELEATVAKLVDRLKAEVQARRESEQRASSGDANSEGFGRMPASRQERIRTHRRLRRQQLEQIREAGEVLRKRFEICEQVLTQRAQLAAAHQVIQETQKKQGSQKAVGRAAMVMGHGTIVMAILAGLSWAVAGQVSPGRFAARATLEADGKGREMSHDELKEWQKFHEDMLKDPQFASKVAEHMKRFAMGAMAEPGAVADRLKTDMSFESARPGVLTVELRGDGPERTARELNAITTKLAAEAVEARARRIDGAVTIIAKEAAADPTPIDSKRLQTAGTILGACAAFGIFVATFIYRRLAAAKQKFERDIALEAILDAARWPSAAEKAAAQRSGDEKPGNEKAAPTRKAA